MMGLRKTLKAASTHRRNLDDKPVLEDSGVEMNNAQKIAVLVAPTEKPKGRRTHRSQLEATTISDLDNGTDVAESSGLPSDRGHFEEVDGLDNDPEGLGIVPDGNEVDEFGINGGNPASVLEANDELDLDEPLDDLDDLPVDELDLDNAEEYEDEDADDAGTEEQTAQAEDEMAIVDVDGIPEDVEEDEILVASTAEGLLVLRANRVIASATAADVNLDEEDLHSAEFASVLASECKSRGLRKGLTALGFKLSKIKVNASHVVERRVEAKARKSVEAQFQKLKARENVFANCLALAGVGLNKGFWPDTPNGLRQALETQFLHAGVQNAKSVVAKIFTAHGIEYAKAMVTVAQRLADMPKEGREAISAALDYTADEFIEEADIEDVEDDDTDFVDATSIEAALVKPGVRKHGVLLTPNQSLTASLALQSSDPIDFV